MFHPWEIAAQTPALARSYNPCDHTLKLVFSFRFLVFEASRWLPRRSGPSRALLCN